ncbi:hypothetical protein D9M72_547190 [compost metagenome]
MSKALLGRPIPVLALRVSRAAVTLFDVPLCASRIAPRSACRLTAWPLACTLSTAILPLALRTLMSPEGAMAVRLARPSSSSMAMSPAPLRRASSVPAAVFRAMPLAARRARSPALTRLLPLPSVRRLPFAALRFTAPLAETWPTCASPPLTATSMLPLPVRTLSSTTAPA